MTVAGPADELGHTLQPRHVTMIALGGVIGAGLFVGSSSAISLGGPGVFLVYGVCGLLVVLVMRMIGEMAMIHPGSGSFAEYVANVLGPWAGFVIRWLYWYCQVFAVGAETVAGAKLLHVAGFPGPVWAVGLGLVAIMSGINLLSVRAYGEVEFWFAMLKVSAIGVFIAVGLAFIAVFGSGPHHALSIMIGHGGLLPTGLLGWLAALPVVLFSMMGSEMATIAASESADPAANIAKAVRSVALRIVVFYVCSVFLITAIVPWNTVVAGLSPFKAALDAIGIPGGGQVMTAIVITAVLSCLNSGIYISSRMLYELGRSGEGPHFLQYTADNKTPVVGVLICCVAGSVAALGQLFMLQDVFTLLTGSAGAICLFIYILIAIAQIRQRRQLEAAAQEIPLKMWLFPWLSYAAILAMVIALILLALMPEQRTTLAISALTVMMVFGVRWLQQTRRLQGV